MVDRPRRKKRDIVPPLRAWPPSQSEVAGSKGASDDANAQQTAYKGLAGADDIVLRLAILMNKRAVSYDDLAFRSGIPARTIKKWFSADEKSRTMPKLNTIQACFEALGHSLIVGEPSLQIEIDQHIYPIDSFRQNLMEDWLEQSARARGVSVADFVDDLEEKHKHAMKNRTKGFRRREF